MKNAHEILITIKDPKQKPLYQVTHIGGQLSNGATWKLPIKEAMNNMKSGLAAYYVRLDGGARNYLKIERHPLYGPFLTVTGEMREPKTLLALPEIIQEDVA